MKRALFADLAIAAGLFLAAAWSGTAFIKASRAAGHRPAFYQSYFEPAVMMACGRGFVVASPALPELQRFLNQEVDTFSCEAIPADQPVGTEGLYQSAWFYLMAMVAATWRLFGVAWSGLTPLYGLLFGTVVALAYGLFRCGMGRLPATLCALALTVSTLHLANLPHLRDYAKAPFILAHMLILAWLVTGRRRTWQLLLLAAAYGLILGVGYGVRTDLLVNIPPFVAAVLIFMPYGWRERALTKVAMFAVAAACFVLTARPVVQQVVEKGGCQFHFALLGLATDFNDTLGVTPSFYQWSSTYSDEYIYTSVNAFANRMRGADHITYCSHEYDVASADYLGRIVTGFPADMLTRAYASTLRVLGAPFGWYDAPLPGVAPAIYRPRGWLLRALGVLRAGSVAAVAAVLLIGAVNTRLGVFALLWLLYFGGYPALQFANRHFFHLEFLGWWALGFIVWQAFVAFRSRGEGGAPSFQVRRLVRFAAIAVLITMAPLLLLRLYQHQRVDHLMTRLLSAPRVPVPMVETTDGAGLRLAAEEIEGLEYDPMRTAYLDIQIDLDACPQGVTLTPRYDPAYPPFNFTKALTVVPPGASPERVLLPVYRYFQGLDVEGASVGCVVRVERLAFVRKVPLLPVLTLPPDWQSLPFHQSLKVPTPLPARLFGFGSPS